MSVAVSMPPTPAMADEGGKQEPFSAGRPAYHFTPPKGWMNDPCAPGYDTATRKFHLMYQWNPYSTEWGNICWGSATSDDMVHWKHAEDEKPVLSASEPYDVEAVFTGCMLPFSSSSSAQTELSKAESRSSELVVAYTSVSHLPFHYTLPHPKGCETVALASSSDGGKTWHKSTANPVVTAEPERLDVTGFRDPFVAPWPALDRLIGRNPQDQSNYALLSGGIRDEGPCLFLYDVPRGSETSQSWKYLGKLLHTFGLNHTFSPKWAADLGVNWECGNFVHLTHQNHDALADANSDEEKLVVLFGSEGIKEKEYVTKYHNEHPEAPRRVPRATNWLSGSLHQRPKSAGAAIEQDGQVDIDIKPVTAGVLDHGIAYAAATFKHPDGRTIMWAWLPEEDILPSENAKKGYTGCMGVPRELFVLTIPQIVGTFQNLSKLEDIPSLEITEASGGRKTATTLGLRPLRELETLRLRKLCHLDTPLHLSSDPGVSQAHRLLDATTLSWELKARIRITAHASQVGVIFNHPKESMSVYAGVVYMPYEETIHVERGRSNLDPHVNKVDDIGSFTLFSIASDNSVSGGDSHLHSSPESANGQHLEHLELRIFRDYDVLEVFANDRFALSTRVYSPLGSNTISIFARNQLDAQSEQVGAVVESLDIWEMGSIGT